MKNLSGNNGNGLTGIWVQVDTQKTGRTQYDRTIRYGCINVKGNLA